MMDHAGRISRLRQRLATEELDAVYISNLFNVRYLCGFTGSNAALLIGPDKARFFTDGRYTTQSAEEVVGADIEIYSSTDAYRGMLKGAAADFAAKSIGFDSRHVTVASSVELKQAFEGVDLIETSSWVEKLRQVKDPEEVELIKVAAEMADAGLAHVLEKAEVGKSEQELALELEFFMRGHGAQDVSFDLIVAAGERSALPHAHPTDKLVEKGQYLLFDLGCIYKGYCSDLTRTVVIGPADDRHRDVYEVVARANQAGLDALGPGKSGSEVDKAARDVITEAGYPEAFSHSLGHGVGIEIHEAPTLRMATEDVVEAGNVVTIEPGAYFPDWGGVRIEDLVVVTKDGIEILSHAPKELIVL